MELAEFAPGATDILLLADIGDGEAGRSVRPQSRKHQRVGRTPNRVLMLGSLRELALYRAEVLSHYGFEVLIPEAEKEAVEVIQDGVFDVAVLSYTLPDTTVRQYVDLIRQRRGECPILAITQSPHYDRRIEPDCVVVGEKGPSELVSALRRLLGRS